MNHHWTTMVLDGFAEDDVDVRAHLAAADQSVRDRLDNEIMSPLANAVAGGAVLVVDGHADRVDTGADHRTSLLKEKAVSHARAENAAGLILELLGRDWLDPPPTAWSDLPYLGVYVNGVGATSLVHDGGAEDDRRRNRRVLLAVCRFTADG